MWSLLKHVTRRLLADRGAMFFITLFPVLMVLILGTSLSGLDRAEAPVGTISALYQVSASDPASATAARQFAVAAQKQGLADLHDVKTLPPAAAADPRAQVADGSYAALVDFQGQGRIALYEGTDGTANQTLEAIMHAYVNSYGAVSEVIAADPGSAQSIVSKADQGSANDAGGGLVQTTLAGHSRSTMDYYAITMLVMMLFMGGAIGGANGLYASRRNGTLRRALASPRSRLGIYGGYLLQVLVMNLVSLIVIMLFSLIFGAHYAATVLDNILLFVSFLAAGMAVGAIFIVVGLFIRVNPMAVVMAPIWVLLFLSGTMTQFIAIPGVTPYLPPAAIQNAAFRLTIFGEAGPSLVVLVVSLVILVVAALVGALIFKRKQVA
ncbi:MAG: ABC transporter permease [Coriobacteriales bacterium]|jgi:ABC-2 type transport system permease protein|nr:ABC transporter permease [Coriobacteriales bacterium]